MKILEVVKKEESLDSVFSRIDTSVACEESVIRRYRNLFSLPESEDPDNRYSNILLEISQQEGARIFPLLTYRGVDVYIMDETTLMRTGTMRSVDGCTTIARCKLHGLDRVVFESGGNSGSGLCDYANKAGIETFLFLPVENLPLLDSSIFAHPLAHLVGVEKPHITKASGNHFGTRTSITHIPKLEWRYMAAGFRGAFIMEYMMSGKRFDWISQTISAAFGPIGIYKVFETFRKDLGSIPRFLGVQQEANCPMFRSWKTEGDNVRAIDIDSTDVLLSRILYDVRPQTYGSHRELNNMLSRTNGDITTVNASEFLALLGNLIEGQNSFEHLGRHGVGIPFDGDMPVERTGLIALAGTLKEIQNGTIQAGQSVLCCLTSAATRADGQARAEAIIPLDGMEDAIDAYCRAQNLLSCA